MFETQLYQLIYVHFSPSVKVGLEQKPSSKYEHEDNYVLHIPIFISNSVFYCYFFYTGKGGENKMKTQLAEDVVNELESQDPASMYCICFYNHLWYFLYFIHTLFAFQMLLFLSPAF